ncbi:MAG: TetR family transcriptional regulator [Polyangiaceae bacterium]
MPRTNDKSKARRSARGLGPEKGATRTERRPLSRERIAEEALAAIDEVGVDGLTMRGLGARLDVEAMALYHHFPSKGDLLDAVAEHLMGELRMPRSGAPMDRIREGLRRYRGLAVKHPRAFALVTTRRLSTPRSLAVLEQILAPFADAGFDAKMSARLFRLGGYFAGGAGHAEIASRAAQPDPTPIRLELAEPPPELPNVARVAPHLRLSKLDDLFEFGLDQIMRVIEASPKTVD